MGSFNTVCVVSRQIVSCGEPVVVIPIVPMDKMISAEGNCYIWDRYEIAFHLPLFATYDDYGNFVFEDNKILDAYKDCIVKNYAPNVYAEGETPGQYDEHMDVSPEDIFADGMEKYDDMMHGNKLCIFRSGYRGKVQVPLMHMVIKRSVFDVLLAECIELRKGEEVYKFEQERKDEFENALDQIAQTLDLTDDEIAERNEVHINQIKEMIGDDALVERATQRLVQSLTRQYGYLYKAHFGHGSGFCSDIMTNLAIRRVAEYRHMMYGLKDLVRMMCELNVEFTPQMYGSQSYDHMYHAKLMTKVAVAGYNNDPDNAKRLLSPSQFTVNMERSELDSYVEGRYGQEPNLKVENGVVIITNAKYNEFNSFRDVNINVIGS